MKARASPDTPLAIFAKGIVAGIGATVAVSLLSRLTFSNMDGSNHRLTHSRHPSEVTSPGEALARAADAGPEGSAGKFALKVAGGIFGRDLSSHAHAAGEVVHFSYGAFWGGIFGLIFASTRTASWKTATALGAGVWALGPALLVPAMKLMPPLRSYPLRRTALLIAGHLVYGWSTLGLFQKLHRT